MAKSESKGANDLGKQRPQVVSTVPAGKAADTAAEGNRGDAVARRSSGPTELSAHFGRYRVKKKLGGGGMGTVYLVENTELEREEALKVPHFADGDDPQLRERFLREAKSAAKLDHANLCPVYDAGVIDGVYYLTMRFLQGKLLSDYVGKAQPARKAVDVVTRLAQALEAAHGKGVIHRDLKPSNVMMVAGAGPVVMDFGLAKQVRQADQKLTQSGAALGTPAYMPPEQVNGDLEQMGPASDVYSLGVILYELLTGRLPFEGTAAAIFAQILFAEPPLPSALVPGLNPTLDGICRKAMAKASTERYPSMKALAAALQDYLRSTPATAGAGDLAPTAVDKAAVFEAATVAPGRQPAGHSEVFEAPTVPPRARRSLPPTPREVQAPSVTRPGQKRRRKTIQKTGTAGAAGTSKRLILIGLAVGGAVVLGILCCIVLVVRSQFREAARTRSANSLKRIGLAMQNYESAYKTFPPAAICAANGKPLLSWRVMLLPYLEHQQLYREFKLDEPWDSEHNRKLIPQMPPIYALSAAPQRPGETYYRAFVGGGAGLELKRALRVFEITDGLSNTILAFEAAESVPWTKPDELVYDAKKPLPNFGNFYGNGTFNALFFDGHVSSLRNDLPEGTLRALITRVGGERIPLVD